MPSNTTSKTTSATRGVQLETQDAVVAYGDRRVLDGASVAVVPGMITGIVGPNGSGKTTLLRVLAGLIPISSGSVKLGGRLMQNLSPKVRAQLVSYMPQSVADHSFTALELVLMGRYPHLGRFKMEGRNDIALAQSSLHKTGTTEFANRQMQTLSGGERQRVSLARTLAQQADAMLLDEPTSSLDMQHQLLTLATARREANEGVAVAIVLHDLSLAAQHCDVLYMLDSGRVVAAGKPWDVITKTNLREVFSVDAAVEPEAISGRPLVSLIGIAGQASDNLSSATSVHIICGAGSGRDLMHRLKLAGHVVTASVLGEGDADRETATRLDIPHVVSSPFSVITLDQDAAHRRLAREADVVVVCEMAVGPGNLRNIEAASEAKRLILLERPAGSEWDYTGGVAMAVYSQLLNRGEKVSRNDLEKVLATA